MKKLSSLTVKEMSDAGQALVLICLALFLILGGRFWVWAALVALVLNMASPKIFRWFAWAWWSLAHALGFVVSNIVLAVSFFLVVTPMAVIRRAMGRDPMALRKWRRGDESVFVERNHTYTADDLRNPY